MFRLQAVVQAVGAAWVVLTAANMLLAAGAAPEIEAAAARRLEMLEQQPVVAPLDPTGSAGRAGGEVGCGTPGTGDCFVNNGSPFCDDANCCGLVCSFDPFCCAIGFPNGTWDAICAGEAEDVCNCMPGDAPPNDNCVDALIIGSGAIPLDNTCATADGPMHEDCSDPFLTGLGLDVWFTYEADFTGPLLVSTCDLVDYDTWIAVYAGCNCAGLSDPPLNCNNDSVGCGGGGSSSLEVEVQSGSCYTIRVGSSFTNPVGSGHLIVVPDPDACELSGSIPGNAITELEVCGSNTNGGCTAPGSSDCCVAGAGSGCSIGACASSVCSILPDCCDVVWDGACALLAHDLCPECPIATQPLSCGAVVHGTVFSASPLKDTDWYELVVTEDVTWTLSVEAEALVEFGLFQADPPGTDQCGALTGAADPEIIAVPCVATPIELNLTPGTYWAFVRPSADNNLPCTGAAGSNDYLLRLVCPLCLPDLNDNGVVNAADLASLLGAWGPNPGHPADLTGNGVVNAADLAVLLGAWGPCD